MPQDSVQDPGHEASVLPEHLKDLYERSTTGLLPDQCQQVHNLLTRYSHLFSSGPQDMGRTDVIKHHIDTQGARPIRQPPRRLPMAKRKVGEDAVADMYERGVIEPSTSPWSSPVVLVKKKSGDTRFCVDYRKLNNVTRKDSYPLPRIDDTLEALAGAEWFSSLDLMSGYWQVEMDNESKEKTAFSTGCGLWQFRVMPFGLCNAPATFERLMEQVLAGLPLSVCLIYLDDILVPGRSFEEEIHNLQRVFDHLQSAGLKLSPKKCFLFQREVKFLGHIVSRDGVAMDPAKVQAVQDWPAPTGVTEVKRFLGLCSYYRRFIRGFADIAHPLHQCVEQTHPFVWTSEANEAFVNLKRALTEAPLLSYPNPDDAFILDTDASNHAVGAVLSQLQEGSECPVAYYSQVLSRPEHQYCTTRKELLAVVKAVKHFHPYLYGRSFILRTDHAALRWLLSFRLPEGQIARWLERLQQYDFRVEHRPGHRHGNADALSRRPCIHSGCKHCDRMETREKLQRQAEEEQPILPVAAASVLPAEEEQPILTVAAVSVVPAQLDEFPWTTSDLLEAQQQDQDIGPVVRWITEGIRPPWSTVAPHSEETKIYWSQWDSLCLREGVLFRIWESPAGDTHILQLLLPKKLRPQVLHLLHNTAAGGHFGVRKTLGRVRERFYWCHCHRDTEDWCRSCDLCASRKGPSKKVRAPLALYNVASPMERLAVDVMGPLPETEAGNKYLLIAMDYFSKWPEAYPLPNQEAVTVAEVLVKELVCRFGVPLYIHSDQGRNFESAVFSEMCHLLGIVKTRTTPLHPQSDGMVERFNRTLEAQLSKFVDDHQRDWDQLVPMMLMAYRSAIHESTGCSPATLMFGRNLKLPIDILYGRPEAEPIQSTTKYAVNLQERLEQVHHFARQRLHITSDKMKRYYDNKLASSKLKQGTAVWLHNPQRKKGMSPKLMRNWQGPYVVIKCINDLVYRIQLGPKSKPKVVHRNRLWQYHGHNPPTWFNVSLQNVRTQQNSRSEVSPSHSMPETESSPEETTPPPRRSTRPRKTPIRYGQIAFEPSEAYDSRRGTV